MFKIFRFMIDKKVGGDRQIDKIQKYMFAIIYVL